MRDLFSRGIFVIFGIIAFIVLLSVNGQMPHISEALSVAVDAVASSVADEPSAEEAATPADIGDVLAQLPDVTDTRADFREEDFGDGWIDVNRNSCTTYWDTVARDTHTEGCKTFGGTFTDPFTGSKATVTKDSKPSVQHLVSLRDAWNSGADRWGTATKVEFANDLSNLITVSKDTAKNRPDGVWLPTDPAEACDLATRIATVKTKYELSISGTDRDALSAALNSCPAR